MAVGGWSQIAFCGSLDPGQATLKPVTALPSTVRVKAEAGGGLDNCRSSENSRLIVSPSNSSTSALVSVGGVVSGASATWKTAESPYMGRVAPGVAPVLPSMGPTPGSEELGRPSLEPMDEPSATELFWKFNPSVPSWLQPVKG